MMSELMGRPEEVKTAAATAVKERDGSDSTGQDHLPIGPVLRKLRGERTLRDVQKGTGIANSYLCNVERGIQQPGLKFLGKIAEYHQVGVADIIRQAEVLRNNILNPEGTRVADVERSYRFVTEDPRLDPWEEPEEDLSIEAKRHVIRIYELLTGRTLLN